MQSPDEYAHALVKPLRLWREVGVPREDVIALLRDLDLSDNEAEAVIARGVSAGILGDDGSRVYAM